MWEGIDPRTDSRERSPEDPRGLERDDPRDVFAAGLDLPRGIERERVFDDHDRTYELRGSEVRTLATVGAFRVVSVDDLRDERGRPVDPWRGDLERLRTSGLIRAVAPLSRSGHQRTAVIALTRRGRALLENHRRPGHDARQTFYADIAKPRELTHDAQLFRAYVRAAERLRNEEARVRRVLLDYEMKRQYQSFLQERNRDRADSDGRPTRTRDEIRLWADEH